MIKVNSKILDINEITFQPLIKSNIDVEFTLEYIQNVNASNDPKEFYENLGKVIFDNIKNFNDK